MDAQRSDRIHVTISGESSTGKSRCLKDIPPEEQKDWIYINTEGGKPLPFRHDFNEAIITSPYDVFDYLDYAADPANGVKGLILDTLTFLMDMVETQHVIPLAGSKAGQAAWGEYAQFAKRLYQEKIALLDMPVLVLAHTKRELDETQGVYVAKIPVKGSLQNNGIEAYASIVVSTKKVAIKVLDQHPHKLLRITERERSLGFKYVFQVNLTKETIGERIRGPEDLFDNEDGFATYTDNNAWMLIQWIRTYYRSPKAPQA